MPVFDFLRRRRHARLSAGPLAPELASAIEKNVALVQRLDAAGRAKLEDLVQVFLHEKTFEGAAGLEVTDEMRATVAAQACILLLGFDAPKVYPDLARVVLYPSAYKATRKTMDGPVLHESEEIRLGESWDRGVVVLAWSAALHGARDARDGKNVVFHELAHQLDQELGDADGAPSLPSGMAYATWSTVLGETYEHLGERVAAGRPTLLDAYGATSPAEFFAVATETFFEKPVQLRARKPRLYEQLAAYYRQDPAATIVHPGVSAAPAKTPRRNRPKPSKKRENT